MAWEPVDPQKEWFPFFGDEWERETILLSIAEQGLLAKLIVVCHRCGSIPDDRQALVNVSRLGSKRMFEKLWKPIEKFFVSDGKSGLICPLLDRWRMRRRREEGLWSKEAYARIYARDGRRCRYCATEIGDFAIDHVITRSQGGGDDDGNLVVACSYCNGRKGGRPPQQAGMVLLPVPTKEG